MAARPAHHTDKGFSNPPGGPVHDPCRGDYWRFIWRRVLFSQSVAAVPDGHFLGESAALNGLIEHDGRDCLTWLGHAAFLLRIGGKTLLLDPYLGRYASPMAGLGPKRFVPAAIAPERLPPIDAIIVSHNHYDHLCTETLARLSGKDRMTAIVPLGLERFLRRRGFRDIRSVDWHDRIALGAVTITALPAQHWSRRTPWDRNKSLWASFAITTADTRLFFAGDTGYSPIFRDIGATHGPFDLALLPIGAYQPRSIMGAHHATPEEAVQLGRDLGAETLVAMHWGTVQLTDEHPFEPPQRFRAAATEAGYAEDRAWLMKIGETRPLKSWPGN